MENRIAAENGAVFYLSPLRLNEISTAKALCDICVGKNLYSEKDLGNTVKDKKQFFWLLKTEDGETAGYIYYKLTNTKSLAKYAKLDEKILLGVSGSGDKIGQIQSVGIKEKFRGLGIAARLIEFAADRLQKADVSAVFTVCWKAENGAFLAPALKSCGFSFLASAENVWYDEKQLICPICGGRCRCGAEIYFKNRKGTKGMKIRLLPKFIISLGVIGLVMTVAVSLFSYATSKSYLENMYAERVMTNSNAIAAMLPAEDVKAIIASGGDKTDAYKKTAALFNKLKKDGNVTFLSLVVPDEDSVHFYLDAMVEEMGDSPENQLAYGSDVPYTEAANPDDPRDMEKYITIWQMYSQNKGLEKPIVTDNSYGYNYTGISVITDENGKAIAEIQYILDMSKVRAHLNSFLINMLLIAFAVIGLTILAYIFFVGRVVTKPIGKLAAFTKNITETGVFENQRISLKTGDEIEQLGNSFNYMLEKLESHIANLSRVTAEKERIGAELDIAKNIQASMLPCIFPAFPERREFDIYATMDPAKEVGGDFYDFFMVDERHLAIVMADVSGKGVPAALFMVIGKTLINDHTVPGKDLGEVFTEVNNMLCESNSEGLFITAFEGVLDLATGEFNFVNAGHEMPFILKAGGEFEPYKIRPGFVLAGMENMKYRAGSITLGAGDKIFQYTDGVTEATSSENELYGMDRLKNALNSVKNTAPAEILDAVKADIDKFVSGAPQFDDITMLCLEYKAKMGEGCVITVPAAAESIDKITEFINAELEKLDCPKKTQKQIDIAADEIFSNIAHYAYESKDGSAEIRLEKGDNPKAVTLTFTDSGIPYNPLEKPDPDVTLSADEREIGGLGIYIVKKTMDEVNYERKDGKNILSVTKYL